MITPPAVEPEASPWRARVLAEVLAELVDHIDVTGRPVIIAVDGRQGGGKTTVVDRVAAPVAPRTR